MKTFITILWSCGVILGIGVLVYNQRQLEIDFKNHWHHAPRDYNVELMQRKLSDSVGYNLTKPKPKWQTESRGYVFWSVCWR